MFYAWFTAETLPRSCEASLKCLQTKGFSYGSSIDSFSELKKETGVHPAVDAVEPVHPVSCEFLDLPAEFHNKPTYHHDFGSWSTFYPDSQKVQQCQMNCFEGQIYPYQVDSQFQYANAPFNMYCQGYPYDFQLQDFQYFVVIDFEATCDRERNPHPQEIIEFPSVIVSSVTGQLEACFQTYVRPTCNPLLTDFCKDLTGIQQLEVSLDILYHDSMSAYFTFVPILSGWNSITSVIASAATYDLW